MKNKKILKFLTILISAAIISNSGLIFAKKEKQIQNVEKEENTKTSGKILKPLTLEERKKLGEQKNKEFFKNLELSEKKDKETIEKNIKKYGNLKKEDLEVEGYILEEIYFKNKKPILVFEHKKTGAKIVIIIDDEGKRNYNDETYFFRFFEPNDKGLGKFLERCIKSKFYEDDGFREKIIKKYEKFGIFANIDSMGLEITTAGFDETQDKINFLKDLFSTFKDPEMLKNKELFEKKKERILLDATRLENQTKKYNKEYKAKEYNVRGIPKEIKNVTFEEVKKIFKETMHPSNLLITEKMKFDPKTIRGYLELLNKIYLENFSRKKLKLTLLN